MILNYTHWKVLTESSNSKVNVRATCILQKDSPSSFSQNSYSQTIESDDVELKLIELFPNGKASDRESIFTIPQDKFEDLDGETRPLVLEIPNRINAETGGGYPRVIWNWFKENAKENFSIKQNVIDCLLKEEFLNYSESEIIAKMSSDLTEKYGISDETIVDEVEHIMLSQSLGEIGGSVSDLSKALLKKIATSISIQKAIEQFKKTDFKLEIIDTANLDEQLAERINPLLIDYSTLSQEELDKVLTEISKTLQVLNGLFNLGKDISSIALKRSDDLLNHLDNYPETLEKLYTDYL